MDWKTIAKWTGVGVLGLVGYNYLSTRPAATGPDPLPAQNLPMFVSAGGSMGGGGFGGGGGSIPSLPQAEFPALPASVFNMPEMPGTNDYDFRIAQLQAQNQLAGMRYDYDMFQKNLDFMKWGIEQDNIKSAYDKLADVTAGAAAKIGVILTNTSSMGYTTPKPANAGIGLKGLADANAMAGQTKINTPAPSSTSTSRAGLNSTVQTATYQLTADGSFAKSTSGPGTTVNWVANLYDKDKANFEANLYKQTTNYSNQDIAKLLNDSGIAPGRVFSAQDVANYKYERGLA